MIIPATLSPRKASAMTAQGDSQEGIILLPRFAPIGCPQSESLQRSLVEHDSPAADRVPLSGGPRIDETLSSLVMWVEPSGMAQSSRAGPKDSTPVFVSLLSALALAGCGSLNLAAEVIRDANHAPTANRWARSTPRRGGTAR
jgi:hypothetical protein